MQPSPAVDVRPGPLLLSGVHDPADLATHTARFGPLPDLRVAELVEHVRAAGIRGRGGAGFPLARKLETVLGASGRLPSRRPVVVVNAAEGEPASAKDSALLAVSPHLVLDGAALAARGLGVKHAHVVTSADRPWVGDAVATALAERQDGIRWTHHEAEGRFVAGQARAVLELMAGREGLPVTAWAPEALDGHKGRPTLLSNAESYAHLAAVVRFGPERYTAHGTPDEPGTTLLTLTDPPGHDGTFTGARVVEVEHGEGAWSVLDPAALVAPLLVGGFHGSWLHPDDVGTLRFSQGHLRSLGASLGAGALLSLRHGACPVAETARYTTYLANESAGRCGPCRNGLPVLADEARALAAGADTRRRMRELTGLVTGRGACAHPDGTSRLVTSLLTRLADRVEAHLDHACGCAPTLPARVA